MILVTLMLLSLIGCINLAVVALVTNSYTVYYCGLGCMLTLVNLTLLWLYIQIPVVKSFLERLNSARPK